MSAPWSDELEAAVLGAALQHPHEAQLVVERCRPDDFYLDTNRRVLAEVARLLAAGHRPDQVAVALALPADERPHVLSLPERCPMAVNAWLYVTRLQALTARRRLALALDMAQEHVEGGLPEQLRAELVAAASDPQVGQALTP